MNAVDQDARANGIQVIARAADILGDPHKYRPDSKETADHSLPAAIEARAGEFLAMLFKDEETTNYDGTFTEASSVWTLESGVAYHPVVLSHESPQGDVIVGLAVLVSQEGERFRHPAAVTAEIARGMPAASARRS